MRNVGKVSPLQMTITTLSGFVDHYTSVTILTDIVAILLKCVTGSYDFKKSMQTSEGKKICSK